MLPTLALIVWPFVAAAIFATVRPSMALVVTIVAGYLLLPPSFNIDFPLLPAFDEQSVPALSALVCVMLMGASVPAGQMRPGWLPRSVPAMVFIVLIVSGAFMTALTNLDPIYLPGGRVLPGMAIYDAFSAVLQSMVMLLPMLLARKFLATRESHRTLLLVLAVAGLGYSLLALYEVRMSPQLNRMVYGYFPHSWVQHIRGDGFRPVVFLYHGLVLSLFLAMAVLAAIGCARLVQGSARALWFGGSAFLAVALVFSKSLGALGITLLSAPLALLASPRIQVLFAAAIGAAIITYPVLRSTHLAPVGTVLDLAGTIDPARAGSFGTRVVNEDRLLEKAQNRPLWGWGGYSRNRVFDERGRDISITDGYWIIAIGQGGWSRYLGEFGLMVLPLVLLAVRWRSLGAGPETALLALILSANLLDLIPNAGLMPMTWLLVGALWGRIETAREDVEEAAPAGAPRQALGYSRAGLATMTEADGPARARGPKRASAPVYRRFSQDDDASRGAALRRTRKP